MRLWTIVRMTLLGSMIIQALGLPIEKELLRVKRKGELEGEDDGIRLHRRDVKPLTSNKAEQQAFKDERTANEDSEIRRRRRFESDQDNTEQVVSFDYPNKMAARSSRSSREDKDITARGLKRFSTQENAVEGDKQPAKRSTTTVSGSGSGLENDEELSGSGMWIPDSAAAGIFSRKVNAKRSASSLESIVAALGAISHGKIANSNGGGDGDESGSGSWDISSSDQALDTTSDDLPTFFTAAASNSHYVEVGQRTSGSGSGMNAEGMETNTSKQGNLVNDLAEEASQDSKSKSSNDEESGWGSAEEELPIVEHHPNHITIKKRDILHQFFEEPGVLHRSRRDRVEEETEENLMSFFRAIKPGQISNEPNLPSRLEPPPIPAVDSTKRDSKTSNMKSGSITALTSNIRREGLTGLSLVRRFYRDQNNGEAGHLRTVLPNSDSLLKQIQPTQKVKKSIEKAAPHNKAKASDPFEARVIHKKNLPKAHVTIIEEPAVYTQNEEEEGMDSSDGGMNDEADDENEPAIEIHERDIREDGFLGCYADQTPDRDLPYPISVRDLTPTTCRLACKKVDHAYAGLQYGYLCRCGDSYGKYNRLADDQCSTACKGDKTQICGGFFRSSVYTTDDVTEPAQGNFYHVETVQPLDAAISTPSYATNYMPITQPQVIQNQLPYSGPVVQFAPSITAPTYFSPEEPKVVIHSETPLTETPDIQEEPVVKAQVENVPYRQRYSFPSVVGNLEQQKKSTIARPPAPQVSHVTSQLRYLHKQHGIVSHGKPNIQLFSGVVTKPGTQTFTGTIKLKQSWLSGFTDKESPEYKILSGNIEEAFKKIFAKNPKFIGVKVLGFNEGLIKHNPATIRKVVAPFVLTFKQGTSGIENAVTTIVKDSGKLFDMPVYKKSIQIQEYYGLHGVQSPIAKERIVARKEANLNTKRSNIAEPKLPYTLQLFMAKDASKKKRSEPAQMG